MVATAEQSFRLRSSVTRHRRQRYYPAYRRVTLSNKIETGVNLLGCSFQALNWFKLFSL